YTIRAQVTEGLNLASDLKASVAEIYAQNGDFAAADSGSLGLPPSNYKSGKYVAEISVENGVITIEYGLQANSKIDGQTIALTPGVNENSDVIWVCGNATAPTGATMQTTGTT